ncbi:PQQ-binding-like beta-propeller repeat protein [Algoriphagus sp.]|uniref:outer membrane protein assembly factor BamB family protein n=1 Tax=Algoriphagus sp. TaxID=1872435 RepID=UPI00326F8121
MKKLILLIFLLKIGLASAQNFKFAFITDTHIGSPNGVAEEDLMRTVADINSLGGLDFAIITGDITEMGTNEEIKKAKELLDELEIPYYVTPGNHDTGWSESGGVSFIQTFGYDKFVFEHKGFKFIGTASGPYVRMSDGHIPRDAVVWLDSVLAATPADQPIINANHYPLDNSLDNWFEMTDRLKTRNTQFSICGHGHTNKAYNFEGIPGTMGRSNLRAKDDVGGFTIVEITGDKALFSERTPGIKTAAPWREIALGKRDYTASAGYERPDFSINDQYPQVKVRWSYHSDANVISTPLVKNGSVFFGNSLGKFESLDASTGKSQWDFQTKGGIFSSPVAYQDLVIFGSGDGSIYAVNSENGSLKWKLVTNAAVLGSPVLDGDKLYIGSSDGVFRALDASSGRVSWEFSGIQGPVVSQPLVSNGVVVFGAWDTKLYGLDQETGKLKWSWDNGSANRMFSPAMCIPVTADGIVYIVAPDRYITALAIDSGEELWRSNEVTVRESIGISADGKLVYGKTMNDEIVAFNAGSTKSPIAWRMNVGFGYEHVPSMLIEKNGSVYFGTKNSTVYSINPTTQQINWAHKIDNSMANTVNVLADKSLVVATMDGKVEWLDF